MQAAIDTAAQAQRLEQAAQWSLRLEDGLSAREEAEFYAWMTADPANRRTFDDIAMTMSGIEKFAGAPNMVSLRGHALTAARRSHNVLRASEFFVSRVGKAASIAFIMILLGVSGYWLYAGAHTVQTSIGERRAVALSDGSELFLDAATELKMNYSIERRRLVLKQGRARFNVAKDSLRPFTVEAAGKIIVAIGTSFSVELIADQVRVALYEGRVEVLPTGGIKHDGSKAILLQPGQQLITDPRQQPQLSAIDTRRALAWESGDLAFTDEALVMAVDRVNRYTKQAVRIGDAAAAQVRISGVFHAGDTMAFIDAVTTLFPVRAEENDGVITLLFDNKRGG